MRRTILVLVTTLLVAIGASAQALATTQVKSAGTFGTNPSFTGDRRCRSVEPAAACNLLVLADSVKGFSGTQGKNGWTYGFYANPPSQTFSAMTQYLKKSPDPDCGAKAWNERCGSYWTSITKRGAHPESVNTSGGRVPTNQWAVRRWTSSSATNIKITGTLAKSNTSCGDGVAGHIFVDGSQVWTGQVGSDDSTGVKFTVLTAVAIGSDVEFALDPLSDDGCDGSIFTAKVHAN